MRCMPCPSSVTLQRGEPPEHEQAVAYYRQALGTLYARVGQRQPARAELSTALALYRSMDMTFWLPLVEAILARKGMTPQQP